MCEPPLILWPSRVASGHLLVLVPVRQNDSSRVPKRHSRVPKRHVPCAKTTLPCAKMPPDISRAPKRHPPCGFPCAKTTSSCAPSRVPRPIYVDLSLRSDMPIFLLGCAPICQHFRWDAIRYAGNFVGIRSDMPDFSSGCHPTCRKFRWDAIRHAGHLIGMRSDMPDLLLFCWDVTPCARIVVGM